MYLDFAKEVALFVGRRIREEFYKSGFREYYKGHGEFATNVDMEAEAYIRMRIKKMFPNHGIIGEEKGSVGEKRDYVWVIDPLDGTHNFMIHMPFFNTSIALEKSGMPIVGVVYNPITDEMFYAEKGGGAFLNGINIRGRKPKERKRRYFGFCHTKDVVADAMKIFSYYKREIGEIRKFGSAALEISYVAAGRLDGFIGYGLHIWDFKAAQLIAEEAGLIAKDEIVNGQHFILVAHDEIYDELRNEIFGIIEKGK